MLLALDIGNSNVTLAAVDDGRLAGVRRARTAPLATPDELDLLLAGLLALDGRSPGDVDAIAVASVVPALTGAVQSIAERRRIPLLVASAETVPVVLRVDRPAEVGADRLVNAFAVARLHGTPAVVVDLGTATTLDCVAPDGAFVGGAIAPGLEIGLDALAARTAKLPRIELVTPPRAIAGETTAAIQSGTVFGYQALVSGLIERVRTELAAMSGVRPGAVRVVLTGGLSGAAWAAGLHGVDAIDTQLTLAGLALLADEVALRPGAATSAAS